VVHDRVWKRGEGQSSMGDPGACSKRPFQRRSAEQSRDLCLGHTKPARQWHSGCNVLGACFLFMPDWRGCGPLDLEDGKHLQRRQQCWPEHDQILPGRKFANPLAQQRLFSSTRDLHLLRRLQSGRRLGPFAPFAVTDTDFSANDLRADTDAAAATSSTDKCRLLQVRRQLWRLR